MKTLLTTSVDTNEDITSRIRSMTINNYCRDLLSNGVLNIVDFDKRIFGTLKKGDLFKVFLKTANDDAKIIDENTGARTEDWGIDDADYGCQTFYARKPEYLSAVSLRVIGDSTDTQTITVKLYAVDTDHKPTGSALATGTASTAFTGTATFKKISFTADYLLTEGTEYGVVFYTGESHASSNDNSVEYNETDNRRGWFGGWYLGSADAGSSWTLVPDRVFAFKLHLDTEKIVFNGTYDNSKTNLKNKKSNIPSGIVSVPVVSHGYKLNDATKIFDYDQWLGHWALKNVVHRVSDISTITIDDQNLAAVPFLRFTFTPDNVWGVDGSGIDKLNSDTYATVTAYTPSESVVDIDYDGTQLITLNNVNDRIDTRALSDPTSVVAYYGFPDIIDAGSGLVVLGKYFYILGQSTAATPFDNEWIIVKCHIEGASTTDLIYDEYYRLNDANMRDNTPYNMTFDGRYFYVVGGAGGSKKITYYDLLNRLVDPYTRILTKVDDFTPTSGDYVRGVSYYWDSHNEYLVETNNSGIYAYHHIINRASITSKNIEKTSNTSSYNSRGETCFGALKAISQALGMNYFIDEGKDVNCVTASDSTGNITAYNGTQDNVGNNVSSWGISKIDVINKVTAYGVKLGTSQVQAFYSDATSIALYNETFEKEIRSENIYSYEEAYDMAKGIVELQKDGIAKGEIQVRGDSGIEINKKVLTNISNGATYVQDTFMKFDAQATDGWSNLLNTSSHTDSTDVKEGDYSLEFSIDSTTTTAGITNTSMSTTDISNYKKASIWVNIGTAKRISRIQLLVGSGVNDYNLYYQHRLSSGWNYFEFDLQNPDDIVGSPDLTSLAVVRVLFTHTSGAAITILVDDLKWLDCRYDVIGVTHIFGGKYKSTIKVQEKPNYITDNISAVQGRSQGAVNVDNPYKFTDGSYVWSSTKGNNLTLSNCVQEDDGITRSDLTANSTIITSTKALDSTVSYGICNLVGKDLDSCLVEISNDDGSTYDEAIQGRPQPFTASDNDIKVRVTLQNDLMMLLTYNTAIAKTYYSVRWFDRLQFPQYSQKIYTQFVGTFNKLSGCYDSISDTIWISEAIEGASADIINIDPKTYKEISSFNIADLGVIDIVFDGTYLWVVGEDTSNNQIMRKYSVAGAQQGGDITTETGGRGIAWDGTNIWYSYADYIAKIDQDQALTDTDCQNSSGNETSRFQDTDFSAFQSLTFDRAGNIWAIGSVTPYTNWSFYQIVRYTTAGAKTWGLSKQFLNDYPMSLFFMQDIDLINPKLQGIELKLKV